MKYLVHQVDLCTGCQTCQMICAYTYFKVNNPKKARLEIKRVSDTETRMSVCVQCRERPCLKVCPQGAITEVKGAVRIDPKKCDSCGICVEVCPYEGIKLHRDTGALICLQCGICVANCPVGALKMVEKEV